MPRRIWVTVKPQARTETVTRIGDNEYRVSVHAPPEHGKANQAVIGLLADYFSVPKSELKIVRGHTAKKKMVSIG